MAAVSNPVSSGPTRFWSILGGVLAGLGLLVALVLAAASTFVPPTNIALALPVALVGTLALVPWKRSRIGAASIYGWHLVAALAAIAASLRSPGILYAVLGVAHLTCAAALVMIPRRWVMSVVSVVVCGSIGVLWGDLHPAVLGFLVGASVAQAWRIMRDARRTQPVDSAEVPPGWLALPLAFVVTAVVTVASSRNDSAGASAYLTTMAQEMERRGAVPISPSRLPAVGEAGESGAYVVGNRQASSSVEVWLRPETASARLVADLPKLLAHAGADLRIVVWVVPGSREDGRGIVRSWMAATASDPTHGLAYTAEACEGRAPKATVDVPTYDQLVDAAILRSLSAQIQVTPAIRVALQGSVPATVATVPEALVLLSAAQPSTPPTPKR